MWPRTTTSAAPSPFASRCASQQKRVNGWHYAPEDLRNEQLRHAVQAVLEDVRSARRDGYPARDAEVDLASALFNAPAIRQEGRRVYNLGGFGLVLACAGPQEAKLHAELCAELCDDLFDSVEIDSLTTIEP